MKTTYILLILLITFSIGCKKEFLEKEPQGAFLGESFFVNEQNALYALTAAYDPLQWEFSNGYYYCEWMFGDICSDDAKKGGSDISDQSYIRDLELYQGKANSGALTELYRALYKGVTRSNLVINNVPNISSESIDTTVQARIVGEAKFLRAYYYFYLTRMWGDVVKVTEELDPSEYAQEQTSQTEIYNLIEEDLKAAIEVLPEIPTEIGRATWGAASALLAKAYVYQGEWSEALTYTQSIINTQIYALHPDYTTLFTVANENCIESIFEIQHVPSSDDFGNDSDGSLINQLQGARSTYGWGFNVPTQDLVDEFEKQNISGQVIYDPRKEATVIADGQDLFGNIMSTTPSETGYLARKYYLTPDEKSEEWDNYPDLGDHDSNGPSNIRIIRYADVLLWHCEALYHTNGSEGIIRTSLNEIRERARNSNPNVSTSDMLTILPDVTAGGDDLLQAIYHERRVELAMEGHRFFDVIRQGRGNEVLGPLGYTDGINNLFPFPQSEIDLSQGKISQNNGY